MELLLRDIETAKRDTSEKGKRRLAALQKHKDILETQNTPAKMQTRWKKVEGKDIIQMLENKTLEKLGK